MLKINEIVAKLNEAFPLEHSDIFCKVFDGYDNSGLIANVSEYTDKLVFALDLSEKVVEYAVENGAQMIVTHHPAIYRPIKELGSNIDTRGLMCAIKNGITVYSMHLNADVGVNGIDESLMRASGGVNGKICQQIKENCGYGRVFEVKEQTLNDFVTNLKNNLQTDFMPVYGDINMPIKTAGTFCGAGGSTAVQYSNEVDVVVSSDLPHHIIATLVYNGKAVVTPTHYASENFGFKIIYNTFKKENTQIECLYYDDVRLTPSCITINK